MQFSRLRAPITDPAITKAWVELFLPENQDAEGPRKNYNFGICLKENEEGEVIGLIGITNFVRRGVKMSEIGYALGEQAWGKGFATEALRGFVDHWFGLESRVVGSEGKGQADVEDDTITAHAMLVNKGSGAVLEKVGFKGIREEFDLEAEKIEGEGSVGWGLGWEMEGEGEEKVKVWKGVRLGVWELTRESWVEEKARRK